MLVTYYVISRVRARRYPMARVLRLLIAEVLMRRTMSAVVLSLVVLLPIVGNAQAPTLVGSSPPLQFGSAQPEVTAAAAAWQVNGEAIVVQGLAYSPTRQFRMFDGNVMTQI